MDEENNSKGVILVLVSMALFSFQDALIKLVFEKAALYEIYFGRTFIASIILGAYLFLKIQKIKFTRANVGDRYVKEKMQKKNFNFEVFYYSFIFYLNIF